MMATLDPLRLIGLGFRFRAYRIRLRHVYESVFGMLLHRSCLGIHAGYCRVSDGDLLYVHVYKLWKLL